MQIKNHYLRQVSDGENETLEKLAQEADERRERGELMGPPPSPIAPPKRRYDQTSSGPSTNAPRSLAPNGEAPLSELPRLTLKRSNIMSILNNEPVGFSRSGHVLSFFHEAQNLSLPKTGTSHPVESASRDAPLTELHVDESG